MRSKDVSHTSSHMVLYNKDRALTLSGAMLDCVKPSLESYTLVFYPHHVLATGNDWGNPIRNILFPDVLRHRQKVPDRQRKTLDKELRRFLDVKFPPYDNDGDDSERDYYSFTNI